jgi:hypothetical protein
MIIKVMFRIRTFLSVLLITILAVADSFVSILNEDDIKEGETAGEFLYHCIIKFFRAVA